MESEVSVEDRLEKLCTVLDSLQRQTTYIRSRHYLEDDLMILKECIFNISSGLSVLKKNLAEAQENNDTCQKLSSLYQKLYEKILHMSENIPEGLIESYVNTTKNKPSPTAVSCISNEDEDQYTNADVNDILNVKDLIFKDCKKELFLNEPDLPQVSLITKEEFDKIPKYMIGRQTLQMVNNLVNSLNKVLKAKYTLLSAGKAAARKKGDLDLYLHYKKQDIICQNSGDTHFFTAEDYQRYIKQKLDRVALKLLMVLRHCKRIREFRVKQELYYIVLAN